MRKNKTTIIDVLVFLLLFAGTTVRAQIITTDYNTCMQGIKDPHGYWLVEPKYDNIKDCFSWYIVNVNGKFGMISKYGTVLIPVKYENLKKLFEYDYGRKFPRYFIATLDGHEGVIDTAGSIIIPFEYRMMQSTQDSIVLMKKETNTWYFGNLKGGIFQAPWKNFWGPRRVAPHAYSMKTDRLFFERFGMCDDSGHVLLEQKYHNIQSSIDAKYVCVSSKKEYGYYDANGKEIWPMKFSYGNRWSSYYNTWTQIATQYSSGPARRNGKIGLINMKGETLIPFEYDDIRVFHPGGYSKKRNLWIVTRDSLYGLYDDAVGWKIPVECSAIQCVNVSYTRQDSALLGLLLYKRNEKWGAATSEGQEILPCIYDEMVSTNEKNGYIFREGNNFMSLQLNTWDINLEISDMRERRYPRKEGYHTDATPNSNIASSDLYYTPFHGYEGVTAYYNAELPRDQKWTSYHGRYYRMGNYYGLTVPDSIAIMCTFYTRPINEYYSKSAELTTMTALHLEALNATAPSADIFCVPGRKDGQTLFTVKQKCERPGYDYYVTSGFDFVSESGRVLVQGDTISYGRIEHRGADGTPYFSLYHPKEDRFSVIDTNGWCGVYRAKHPIGDFNSTHHWEFRKNGWQLVANRTSESVLPKKTSSDQSAPLWDSVTYITNRESGMRLYNYISKKFLLGFSFADMRPLDPEGKAFAIKTCSGKMGVIDAQGNRILDTMWTAMKEINYITTYTGHSEYYLRNDQEYHFYQRYLFYNADSSVVLDRNRGIKQVHQMQSVLWQTCATQLQIKNTSRWICDSIKFIKGAQFYYRPTDSAQLLSWHQRVIIDTVYSSRRFSDDEPEEGRYYFYNSRLACRYCMKRDFAGFHYYWTTDASLVEGYFPVYLDDSLISFSAVSEGQQAYWGVADVDREWCSTVMLFPDGIHNMTIDSIFNPASDWRNFLINYVIEYVNTHQVKGDCHNPQSLPGLLANRFLITTEGIHLFPPEFYKDGGQLELIMPWEVADPYLRNDIKSRLPINGN